MIQSEWYCDKCECGHFGNCPRVKTTVTTTHHNGCLICQGGAIGMNPLELNKIVAWHNEGHPQGSDLVSFGLKPIVTYTKSAHGAIRQHPGYHHHRDYKG